MEAEGILRKDIPIAGSNARGGTGAAGVGVAGSVVRYRKVHAAGGLAGFDGDGLVKVVGAARQKDRDTVVANLDIDGQVVARCA